MAVQKKFALGRGLDALISNEEVKTSGSSSINEIELDKISVNPNQPRREFDPIALQELADSIAEIGIIQPITLRKLNEDSYQIIAGERRYRASILAGLKTIPVVFNTAKMNGTFDYKVDTEDKDKLAFDVSSATERGNGVDVSSALVWKDASDRQLWPSTNASDVYQNSKGAEIFGFTVAFELVAGEDNGSFDLNPTTGKLTLTRPTDTQGTKAMTVKVKAIPTSPWGTVEPRVVTVTVAEWVD
jgi:hypothetical protein